MKVRILYLCTLSSLVLGAFSSGALASPTPIKQVPANSPSRHLVYDGLEVAGPTSRCSGYYKIETDSGQTKCSHGPDRSEADFQTQTSPGNVIDGVVTAMQPESNTGKLQCTGDGSNGNRVQVIYAYASDVGNKYSTSLAPKLNSIIDEMDGYFQNAAVETGGIRHVSFVTNSGSSGCALSVPQVGLSSSGDNSFDNTINELQAKGYTRSDRKYLVFMESSVYCGIGEFYDDDRKVSSNYHNGSYGPLESGMFARIDKTCFDGSTAAHEIVHNMGGVALSAPHGTSQAHCFDEQDIMCYDDSGSNDGSVLDGITGVVRKIIYPCASTYSELDCNHDDYFNANPASSNYLATHWNVADSKFLTTSGTSGGDDGGGGAVNPPAQERPETTITSGPNKSGSSKKLKGTRARFKFSSSSNSVFYCKLDKKAFSKCSSPKIYSNIKKGYHTFKVYAQDKISNLADDSPARVRFKKV